MFPVSHCGNGRIVGFYKSRGCRNIVVVMRGAGRGCSDLAADALVRHARRSNDGTNRWESLDDISVFVIPIGSTRHFVVSDVIRVFVWFVRFLQS